MTTVTWDQVGSRFFEVGVDRGVLYLPDGKGIPWSGLISVNEQVSGNDPNSVYFDGVKYSDVMGTGEFSATLSAYTYPDEFLQFEGVFEAGNGLYVTNQPQQRFGLSYRTRIGSDEDQDLGYKIHVLYNLTAVPSQKNFQAIGDTIDPIAFEWTLSSMPSEAPPFRPTSHLIFDTRKMSPLLIQDIENTLYGTPAADPILPPLNFFVAYIGDWVIMRITDNLDGTWTATGPDEYFVMLDSTTFQINNANATYLDGDTYVIGDLTY